MKPVLIVAAVLLVLILAVVILTVRRPRMKHGEILPTNELKEKYGLHAENRPDIKINSANVPENLRDLIPIAEKWGVGDDVIRADIEEKASPQEKEAFKAKLKGRTKEVSAWLDSFPQGQAMSQEAAHFMYMLQALDETGLWPD